MPASEQPFQDSASLQDGNRRGILFMVAAVSVFAVQDGVSRHLAEAANPVFVVTIRYWALALFVILLAARRPGGIARTARSRRPWLQAARAVLLAVEVVVTVWTFTLLGLAEAHAIFAVYPLIVIALSVPFLGERVGWRRAAAVFMGFVGVLIILRPGLRVFEPGALVALLSALLFAVYGVLTRLAARYDTAETSFFWTGIVGALFLSGFAPFFWSTLSGPDWTLMAILCVTGAGGHFLLIKALEAAAAAVVQPFAYLQLVLASAIGVFVFADRLETATMLGAAVIVLAGIYAFLREAKRRGGA